MKYRILHTTHMFDGNIIETYWPQYKKIFWRSCRKWCGCFDTSWKEKIQFNSLREAQIYIDNEYKEYNLKKQAEAFGVKKEYIEYDPSTKSD